MQKNTWLYIGGGVALLLLLSNTANANSVSLNNLNGKFAPADIARLQRVQDALVNSGLVSDKELLKFMLAQILHETGLFTSSAANYRATDQLNNFAGISKNGQLKAYNTIDDFVTDYVRVLSLPNAYPISAMDINDFNDRLKANGYYTDSKTTYGNALNFYYNLLN